MSKALLPRVDQHLPEKVVGNSRIAAYDIELGLAICERVTQGQTLDKIERELHVSKPTIYRWALAYPEFGKLYHEARELSSYAFEDEALRNARLIRAIPGDSARVRAFDIAINHLRWLASRRNPRVFSDRAASTFTIPIQINTSLDLSEGPGAGKASERSDTASGVYTIEATVVEDIPDAKAIGEDKGDGAASEGSKTTILPPSAHGRTPKTNAPSKQPPKRKRGVYG